MGITLGKDCTIQFADITPIGVRSVTLSETARTIEVNAYHVRDVAVHQTGYDCSVSIELNDNAALNLAFQHMHAGTTFNVQGGASGFSFLAVMTSISESDTIDGVATFTIEAKMAHPLLTRT